MRVTAATIVLSVLILTGCEQTPPSPPGGGNASTSDGQEASDVLAIGDPAPAFTELIGVDDQTHSLEDYADAKAVAIVFTCNHCPVAEAYEDRLVGLHNDYADKDVQLVAINVNNLESDKLPAMKERAEEQGFEFAYLYDPTQQVGREFGATVTPHAFLLDGERNLVYAGAIDDNENVDKVSEQFLRLAIDAVLAGETPAKTKVDPVGCGIAYE